MTCDLCRGPCRLEDWARDTSNITNNPAGQRATIVRRHRWFRPDHVDGVKLARAALRAMPTSIVFPCVGCDRYAFPEPGTTCYWCKTGRVNALPATCNVEPESVTAPASYIGPDPDPRVRTRKKGNGSSGAGLSSDLFS